MRHAPTCVPERYREQLRKRALESSGRSLRHSVELARITAALEKQEIETICLKGAPLSLRLFGEPSIRHVQDIDLLARPGDLDRIHPVLTAMGYERTFPKFEPAPKVKQAIFSQHHHATYWHPRLRVMIELHWRVDQWAPEDVAQLWAEREKTSVRGTSITQLNEDALILFLCSHGAGHKWSHLKWLADVAVLLACERDSWQRLLEMAARLDLERPLAQAAVLVYWLYGVPLNPALCALIREEKQAFELAEAALKFMLLDQASLIAAERLAHVKYARYALGLRKRLTARAYLRQVLISPEYLHEIPTFIPDQWFWLHYVMRPLVWLRRTAKKKRRRVIDVGGRGLV